MRVSRPSGSSRRRPPRQASAHDRCRGSRRHRRRCPRPGGRAATGLTVPLTLIPLAGMPEVRAGADLASLIVAAVGAAGEQLAEGDVLVVSSKVVSKALGLWAEPGADRDTVIAAQTRRLVAERVAGGRVTRIVQAAAGPVMAAAGVDGSNTGGIDRLLLLPDDPDAE